MAVDFPLIPVITAIAYGVIPLGLWWVILHYPSLRVKLLGLFAHMLVVCVRSALRVTWPESVFWGWGEVHTVTAILSAICFIAGIGRQWRQRKRNANHPI